MDGYFFTYPELDIRHIATVYLVIVFAASFTCFLVFLL
jgi:hypothetical protein